MRRRALIQSGLLAIGPAGWVHAALPDVVARIRLSIAIVGTLRPTDAPRFRLRGSGFVVGTGSSLRPDLRSFSSKRRRHDRASHNAA